ncbi:keratinocyte differentiation factor 1 [Sarotherodon galilaeus]
MIWRCFICYVFVALSLRQLLSDINTMHSRSPDFRVVCGIDGCPSEYRVYNSFYYHVKRTHAHHLLGVEADEEEGSTRHGLHEDGEGHLNLDIYKHATAFLLQAKETHGLTQRAVNHIVSGVQQYQAVLLEHLKQQMSDMIERHSGDLDQLKSDAIGVFDQFVDPFTQIASTHLQDKTIKELLKPVEPEIIVTKQTVCYSKRGDSRVLAIKDHCFHYIPLVKSLEQLQSHVVSHVEHVVSVQWIMLHGNKHSCEKSLVISDVINDAPEFALVKNIYIVNASVYCFECQPLSTVGWKDQYLAYEVEVPCLAQANIFVDAGNLVDYTAYHYVNFNNSSEV